MHKARKNMIYNQVKKTIEQYHMIEQGDRIILGLSGGSDSVCLFHVLLRLKQETEFQLIAVHVHHGLRGEEADRDEEFVKNLCEQNQIPLKVYRQDVAMLAKEWNMSVEEAGRTYRYQVFRQEAQGTGKIATAHHANDQAETMLFHLTRGTGLRGLGGIAPVMCSERGNVIRPLLFITKEKVWNYLCQHKLDYCNDSTNESVDYSRNKIRQEVIPVLQGLNEEAIAHMTHTAELLRECDTWIQTMVKQWVNEELSIDQLCRQPVFLQKAIIKEAIVRATGKAKDVSAVHVEQVLELCSKATGKQVVLPYETLAVREYDKIRFRSMKEVAGWSGIPVTGEGTYMLPDGKGVITVSIYPYEGQGFSNNEYTKTLDYDTMGQDIWVRYPRPGDRMVINDAGNEKKLNRYFIDEKVDRFKRETSVVIAEGRNIIWVVGGRIANPYKITEQTRRVIKITYKGEQ